MLKNDLPDNIFTALAITTGGLLFYQLVFFIFRKWSRTRDKLIFLIIKRHLYLAGFLLMLVITLLIDLSYVQQHFNKKFYQYLRHGLIIFSFFSIAFLIVKTLTTLREVILSQYKKRSQGDFSLRKANTKFVLIQQVLNILIYLTAASIALMTFESVKQLGSSLLASAGVVGLILGFAAQKSLGTFFAGIQIAISQPIRLDDTVVVEGRFGTIGEISLTYVIVNVWDGSRLVVPINYFLEKPFENWTRVSADVIAKVTVEADYTLPVDLVRAQFFIWLSESPLWDKRSAGLVVLSASYRTIEIRATMSTRNSGDAFELACSIREKLIEHIRIHHPESLPRLRVEQAADKHKSDS